MPETITHVHVRFVDDKVVATVPRTSVKRFSPKHSEDFDKDKLYLVLWEEPQDAHDKSPPVAAYYKANILLLGTSEEDIKTKLKAGRLKFSTKRPIDDTIDEKDTAGSEAGDAMKKKKLKKLRSAAKKDINQKILNEKMNKLKSQKLQMDSTSEEEGKSDDDDTESVKSAGGSPAMHETKCDQKNKDSPAVHETKCDQKYKELSEQYSQLIVRVVNLEAKVNRASINSEPRERFGTNDGKVNRKLFSEQENASSQKDLPTSTETFIANTEGSGNEISALPRYAIFSTTIDNTKVKRVHLGSGISIDKDAWAMIEVRSEDTKFVKELATAVWTRSTLINRSLDGKAAGRLPGQGTRKALSPLKMSVVRKCFEDRLKKKDYKGEQLFKELKRMNSFLTELINDFIKREVKALKAQDADSTKAKEIVDKKLDKKVDTEGDAEGNAEA